MGCLRVHDFINGTTIALPPVSIEREVGQRVWDILRPNQQASELVARHVQLLGTLSLQAESKGPSDVSAEAN